MAGDGDSESGAGWLGRGRDSRIRLGAGGAAAMASGSWSGRRDNLAAAGVLAPAFAAVGVHGSSLAAVGVHASSLFAAGDHADVDGGSGGGWLGRDRDFTDPVGAGDGDGGNGGDCSGAAKRWRRRIWRRGRAGDDGATAARASMADLASGTATAWMWRVRLPAAVARNRRGRRPARVSAFFSFLFFLLNFVGTNM